MPSIFQAVVRGDYEAVRGIVRSDPDAVHAKVESNGETALHLAVWYGHIAMAKALVEAGADVNAVTVVDDTPLAYAFQKEHQEIIDWLVSIGGQTY